MELLGRFPSNTWKKNTIKNMQHTKYMYCISLWWNISSKTMKNEYVQLSPCLIVYLHCTISVMCILCNYYKFNKGICKLTNNNSLTSCRSIHQNTLWGSDLSLEWDAQIEDKCKMHKRFITVHERVIMILDEKQKIYLFTLYFVESNKWYYMY